MTIKLGIELDWQTRNFVLPVERIQLVDRLGYDFVFAAEGNGSDAITPLAYTLAITKNIGVGTRIAQIPARSPTALAMAAQMLKSLGGGRAVSIGLGNTSVEQAEGWHGKPWGKPLPRMRDYVTIMRQAASGQPVDYQGKEISIPYMGEGANGARPLAPMIEVDPSVKLFVAAGAEAMIALAAEIGDGWLPTNFAPGMMPIYQPFLDKGFARAPGKRPEDFEIWNHVDLTVTDDIKAAMWPMKQYLARWAGGWSAPGQINVFRNIMMWRGYGELQQQIEERWQAGHEDEAASIVPDDYIDDGWLLGPLPRIVERWKSKWLDSGLTGIILRTDNLEVFEPLYRAAR